MSISDDDGDDDDVDDEDDNDAGDIKYRIVFILRTNERRCITNTHLIKPNFGITQKYVYKSLQRSLFSTTPYSKSNQSTIGTMSIFGIFAQKTDGHLAMYV